MTAQELKKMIKDVLKDTSLEDTTEFLEVIEETAKEYSSSQTKKLQDLFHQMCGIVQEFIEGGKFYGIEIITYEDGSIAKYESDDVTSISYALKFLLDSKQYSFDLSCLIPWGWYNIDEEFSVQIYADDDDATGLEKIHKAILGQFPSHEYNVSDEYIDIPCTMENLSTNAIEVLNILNNLNN